MISLIEHVWIKDLTWWMYRQEIDSCQIPLAVSTLYWVVAGSIIQGNVLVKWHCWLMDLYICIHTHVSMQTWIYRVNISGGQQSTHSLSQMLSYICYQCSSLTSIKILYCQSQLTLHIQTYEYILLNFLENFINAVIFLS